MTDTQRLDWLEAQHGATIRNIRDLSTRGHVARNVESELFRQGMRVELFTVASQHVYGSDLRAAIDTAQQIRGSR